MQYEASLKKAWTVLQTNYVKVEKLMRLLFLLMIAGKGEASHLH